MHIETNGDERSARIDLPGIGVLGWPAQVAALTDDEVRLEFSSDSGTNVLSVRLTDERLQGEWNMAGESEVAAVALARSAPPKAPATQDVSFRSGDITLHGTIVAPEGSGPWPGVVFVHGAGDETRDASRFLATYYAQHGIASLIYDKRGTGASGGDWRSIGFDELADDVLAAVQTLRQHPGVDQTNIGLRGQSQGGWVAPLAASRSTDVGFVITVAGPLVSPAVEGHWDAIFTLRQRGFDEAAVAEAETLLAQRDTAIRTKGWDVYRAALDAASERPWFSASGLGVDVDPDFWMWTWYPRIMDFDPVPVFEGLAIPVLAQFGAEDESIPAEQSAAILQDIRDAGHKPFTVAVYPGTSHAMRNVPSDQGFRWPAYADGFLDRQVEWILEQAAE